MKRSTIVERRVLEGLNSTSALEQVGDSFYVIGDDSPFLFRLDRELNLVAPLRLFDIEMRDTARIAKGAKPDLEALCCVERQGRRELLCFGSGSKVHTRDVCWRVDVTKEDEPQNVRRVEMSALYDALRADAHVVGSQMLNVEAACCTGEKIFLFQRGNISGRNTRIEFELSAFMEYLDAPGAGVPEFRVASFELPKIGTRWAGFSAASTREDLIWFAAAVEDTDNEIDDGEKLGTFVGCIRGDTIEWIEPVRQGNEIAAVKIEGIAVLEVDGERAELAAVTDDDEGESEILRILVADGG